MFENDGAQSAFDRLEAATKTLQKEKEFFDALMEAGPIAKVASRIILLATFYQEAVKQISCYLSNKNLILFDYEPLQVASTLSVLLIEITRSVRLATYLSVKGVFPQAVSVLRGAIEQIGIYRHIWEEPHKIRYFLDSDSEDYARAFRYTADNKVNRQLKSENVQYRFMHCKNAAIISKVYKILSAHFIHGLGIVPEQVGKLSCEFIDRADPQDLREQYEIVQTLLSLIFFEILDSIPEPDRLDEDVAALSLLSAIFLPTLAFSPDNQPPELAKSVDQLLEAISNMKQKPSE